MENNQYVIRNNNGSANIETLSIKDGCIDAGSLSFSDDFRTISGKLLCKKGFVDGETVTVLGLTAPLQTTIHIDGDTFTLTAPSNNIFSFADIKGIEYVDFIEYDSNTQCDVYYDWMSTYDVNELSDGRPYIIVDDQYLHFTPIEKAEFSYYAAFDDGTERPVWNRACIGSYGSRLLVSGGDSMLNVSVGDTFVAKVVGTNHIVCDISEDGKHAFVAGVQYDIEEGIKYTIMYGGEEREIVFDGDECRLVDDETVAFTCDVEHTTASMLEYASDGSISSVPYTIKKYDGIAINGNVYVIDDGTLIVTESILGYFEIVGRPNDYEAEMILSVSENQDVMLNPDNYVSLSKTICTSVVFNKGHMLFYKIGSTFGNKVLGTDGSISMLMERLEIRHDHTGYTIPLFVSHKVHDNLFQEDIVNRQYAEIKKDEILRKHPIIDMERDQYTPVYKPSGNYSDYYEAGLTPVEEVRFNLHFRTRNLDTWQVIEDDKSSDSIGMCNWFVTDYYNVKQLVEPRVDGKDSQYTTNNVLKQLYKSSDLLGFLGFSDSDITGRSKKLSKSFLRLMFYDSPDPLVQTLLYSSTIHLNVDQLNGIKMRNIGSEDKFIGVSGGLDGFFKNNSGEYRYYDFRLTGTVIGTSNGTLMVKYGDRQSPLFDVDDELYVRLVTKDSSGTVRDTYNYKLTSEDDVNDATRVISLHASGTVPKFNVGDRVYIYRSTVMDNDTRYIMDTKCTTMSEPLASGNETDADGKTHNRLYPSFDREKRLSSQLATRANHVLDDPSDGFYLYIFKEYAKKAHPQEIYMKVEFNHAGTGMVIPFMRLVDNTGSELTSIDEITSDIKAGYPIKQALDNMYIPISVVYDTKLDKYVWYYKGNKSATLDFNLFEVKYQATESISPDCQLALTSYGNKVSGIAGEYTVKAENMSAGAELSTVITYSDDDIAWLNADTVDVDTLVLDYDAIPAVFYSKKTADDDTLRISRECNVRIQESSSCYTDHSVTQSLTGYVFASRPYTLNGTTKEYLGTLGAKNFEIGALSGTYYIDVLCDTDSWKSSIQGASGGMIATADIPNKRVVVKIPTNTGGVKTMTVAVSTSGGDKLHESQTITFKQATMDDLFNTTPPAGNGLNYDVSAGSAVYYIDTNEEIDSFTTDDTWANVSLIEVFDDLVSNHRYKLTITYGSNMPVGTATNSSMRSEEIVFTLGAITKTISISQDGYTIPMLAIDYRKPAFYFGKEMKRRDTSVTAWKQANYTDNVFVTDNETEYFVCITGKTSFDDAAIDVLDEDHTNRFEASVATELLPDGYTRLCHVTIHSKVLPYNILDRLADGAWSAETGSFGPKFVVLRTGSWDISGTGRGYYSVMFEDGDGNAECVAMAYEQTDNVYYCEKPSWARYARFMRHYSDIDTAWPMLNALEVTDLLLLPADRNIFEIARGFYENTFKLYNAADPDNETTTSIFTIRQISDRRMALSGNTSGVIKLGASGGSDEIKFTVVPTACQMEFKSETYDEPFFELIDGNHSDIYNKTVQLPASSGKLNVNITAEKNIQSVIREPSIINVHCTPKDDDTEMFTYAFSVSQDAYVFNAAVSEAHPVATVDLSFGGEVVNVIPQSISLGRGLIVSGSTYAITYTYDNTLNMLTIVRNGSASGIGTKVYTDDINITYTRMENLAPDE